MQKKNLKIQHQQARNAKLNLPFSNHLLTQILNQSYMTQQKEEAKIFEQKQNYNFNLPADISFGEIHLSDVLKMMPKNQYQKEKDFDNQQTLDYYLSFDQENQIIDTKIEQIDQNIDAYKENQDQQLIELRKESEIDQRQSEDSAIKINEQQQQENQFKVLKDRMTEIEYIASMEIKLLKQKLESKERYVRQLQQEIRKLKQQNQRTNQFKKMISVQAMTQGYPDCRDSQPYQEDIRQQEIAVLKLALIRHVRINKYLTAQYKSAFNQKEIQGLINKIEKQAIEGNQ